MTPRDAARAGFLARAGWGDATVQPLAGDASFRRYYRLRDDAGRAAMLMDAPPPHEDTRPFVGVAALLHGLGYSAPRILMSDQDQGFLILEDLGDATFTRLIADGADEAALYRLATDLLADLFLRFDPGSAHGLPAYADDKLLAEADLLLQWFLSAATGAAPSDDAIDGYRALWRRLLPDMRAVPATLVLRDYHVDNLMRLDRPGLAACGLLDFQDAVIGPVTYDLMSLVEDARRAVPAELGRAMIDRFLHHHETLDPVAFERSFALLAAQRHAKVIGIFCRLAIRDGKPRYLRHLPHLWRRVEHALAHPALAELADWVDRYIPPSLRGIPPALQARVG